jgi:hypothetical protein
MIIKAGRFSLIPLGHRRVRQFDGAAMRGESALGARRAPEAGGAGFAVAAAVGAMEVAADAGDCGRLRQSIRLTTQARLSTTRATATKNRTGFIALEMRSSRSIVCLKGWSP